MATKHIYIILATVLLLATSCNKKDVNMHTVINSDGTCSREFIISIEKNNNEPDSIGKRTFTFDDFIDSESMEFDKSWKISWSVKGDSTKKAFPIKDTTLPIDTFQVIARQDFLSIHEMTGKMPLLYNGNPYKAKGKLDKSFKWFYTDYTYTETYSSIASAFAIPVTKYVEKDTASYWFSGQPDIFEGKSGVEVNEKLKDVEMKIWQWIFANMVSDACELVSENYNLVVNAPMSKDKFMSNRDSLVAYSQQHSMEMWDNEHFLEQMFNEYFHSNSYGNVIASKPVNDKFSKLILVKYGILSSVALEYTLTMPGKIIDVGNGKIDDGVVHYKFGPEMFTVNDYTIFATSRVNNIWAYVVSILIILVAIFSFWYKKK